MVVLRRVRDKLKIGENGPQKQPGAEIARDEIGVLALPAKPGGLGQRLLHHWRGVDEDLDLARIWRGAGGDEAGELL